jgi:glycolate oxidase FAD binding subunit
LTPSWPDSAAGGSLGDGRHAAATERPESVEALCQAVAAHVAQGRAIYPQGGKTALDYGGIPRAPGVAVDTSALAQVIDYPAADMTITVQAGITMAVLRTVLAGQHQRLLVDAPQADRATLGGVYATNTSGPRRYGAGRPRDQIIGVSFVSATGAVVKGGGRVVKNVAGYDFPKLLTGSMGTLGIIIQLTLKVRPISEHSAICWIRFPALAAAELEAVLERLNTSQTRPIALELLNPTGAQLTGAGLGLPVDGWVLAAGFEDNAGAVAWQVDRLGDELGRAVPGAEFVVCEGAAAEPLWSALTEFPAVAPGELSITANVRPSSVAGFVHDLDAARWAVQAHAGNGIVRAHALGALERDAVGRALDRLRARAVEDGGNLILPRCPTEWKAALRVWGEPRPDWALAQRVKAALDPSDVMNPGRFIGTM